MVEGETASGAGGAPALPATATLRTPSLTVRLASMLYEGVLLFGVFFIAAYLYSALTQQRHAMQGRLGLQVYLFVVLGVYFVWFWTHGGQTVAMKTWRVRLVDLRGKPVGRQRAVLRYLASWLWFLPALLAARVVGWHEGGAIFALLALGVAIYAAASRLHPDRQFPHDALCGTRLVDWRPAGD